MIYKFKRDGDRAVRREREVILTEVTRFVQLIGTNKQKKFSGQAIFKCTNIVSLLITTAVPNFR